MYLKTGRLDSLPPAAKIYAWINQKRECNNQYKTLPTLCDHPLMVYKQRTMNYLQRSISLITKRRSSSEVSSKGFMSFF